MSETKKIDDGYTFTRTLPKVAFVEGQVEITFRPAAGASHRAFSRALMGRTNEATAVGAGIIAESVASWNLRKVTGRPIAGGSEGEAVPVTAEEAAKLPSAIFTEILDALFGFSEESATAAKN